MTSHGYKRNAGRNFGPMLEARLIPLSSDQRQIILGTLMGDGCLIRTSAGYRLGLSQGFDQLDYLQWKRDRIGHIFLQDHPHLYEPTRTASFQSMSHPDLVDIHELVYRDGKKVVSPELLAELSPLSLAFWFMDDGSFLAHPNARQIILCTDNFSNEENHQLIDWFGVRYGIVVKEQYSKSGWNIGKTYTRLRINRSQVPTFDNLVRPFMCPSMLYKLPVK